MSTDTKELSTLKARAALAGHTVYELANGAFLAKLEGTCK